MDLDNNQIEKLMAAEVNRREAIAKHEQEIKEIKSKREKIQQALNEACRKLNVSSLKTEVGTLSRQLKTRYWTSGHLCIYF